MKIDYYKTEAGNKPVIDWMWSRPDAAHRKSIFQRIDRIRDTGNLGDVHTVKPTEDDVSEIRIHFGPGYRIYYAVIAHQHILLLCAGDKGTQEADIARAKRYWRDYQMRGPSQ